MRKIWNTLIYGDRRTKAYLWSIVLLILLAVASCAAFAVTLNIWWVMGILGGLIAAAVIGSSVKFREVEGEGNTVCYGTGSGQTKTAAEAPHDSDERMSAEDEDEGSPEENERFLKSLQKKQVKKLLYKYKVKKIHYPILIEVCESRQLRECPAYVWTGKGCLRVLALTAKTRLFEVPLSQAHTLMAERAVRANPKEEYASVKESKYIAKVFQQLIPSYYIMADENGRRTYRKNRYVLGDDLVVTDRSARALLELTQAGFVLPEDEKMARAYGTYATEAYKLKFLCQDGVILPEEYKVKIRILLQQMVEADISDYEFSKNLSLMVKKQLITDEYAKYYEDARLGR